VQFNNAGAFGANSNFTYSSGSNVLNLGTSLVPGTHSVGVLDAMTISGVAITTPGFAINSNTQGNIEAHSYSSTSTNGSTIFGARSRGTLASPTAVVNGDNLLTLAGAGYDGTNYTWGAHIHFLADGTPSAGVLPGAIDFQTTPSASNTPVSVLKLDHAGSYFVNGSQGTAGNVLTSGGTGATAWGTVNLASANAVTNILGAANGGTGNGFFAVSGPATTTKTFTFPNASATVLTSNAAVTVPQGGTGVVTLTTHGVLLGEGTSNVSTVAAMAADTVLMGVASADPAAVAVNNCGSASTALSYSTSTHTFGCQTISVGGSGTVTNVASGTGLSGGPITTTGTLTVDQSFSPTWTGTHTFSNAPNLNAGANGTATVNGTISYDLINNSTGVNAVTSLILSNGSTGLQAGTTGQNNVTPFFTGGPTSSHVFIGGPGGIPISIGTNGTERIRIANAGRVTINAATSDTSLVVSGTASSSAAVITAPNSAGVSLGLDITAGTNSTDYALRVQGANGSSTDLFRVQGGGVLTAPTNYSSAGAVSTTAAGVFTTASDLRLKTVVGPATVGLAEVMKLKPIRYRWTEASGLDDPKHTVYAGFGAQDVLPWIPDAVGQNPHTGYYSLSDRPIIAAIVNAVQEQQREINSLRKEVRSRGR
jgi:hypothetical protein